MFFSDMFDTTNRRDDDECYPFLEHAHIASNPLLLYTRTMMVSVLVLSILKNTSLLISVVLFRTLCGQNILSVLLWEITYQLSRTCLSDLLAFAMFRTREARRISFGLNIFIFGFCPTFELFHAGD